jgi:hypothetical protein
MMANTVLFVTNGYCESTLNVVARPNAAEVLLNAGTVTVNYTLPLTYAGAGADGGGDIVGGSTLRVIAMAGGQRLADQQIDSPLSFSEASSQDVTVMGTFSFYNPQAQVVSISGSGTYTFTIQQRFEAIYPTSRQWMVLPGQTTILGRETSQSLSQTGARGQSSRGSAASSTSTIHAVIISGLSDPAKVIVSPNVTLTGGVIALGKDPTPPATPSTWSPGLRIVPDYALLTGEKIPPITPNILDVRIVRQEVTADFPSPSPQPSD